MVRDYQRLEQRDTIMTRYGVDPLVRQRNVRQDMAITISVRDGFILYVSARTRVATITTVVPRRATDYRIRPRIGQRTVTTWGGVNLTTYNRVITTERLRNYNVIGYLTVRDSMGRCVVDFYSGSIAGVLIRYGVCVYTRTRCSVNEA